MKNPTAFRKFIPIFFVILLVTCKHDPQFKKIRSGNFDIVIKGKYQGRLTHSLLTKENEETVNSLRASIEKNYDVLQLISEKYFDQHADLLYSFMYAAVDQEKNCLVLRYFARIPDDPIYAGYQIQFVYGISPRRLVQIFTTEVPLE